MLSQMLKISLLLAMLISCTKTTKEETPKDASKEIVQTLDPKEVILEYNGGVITAKDVNELVKPQIEQMRQLILSSYIKAAEELLVQKMSEKLKGGEELVVSDVELNAYLKSNNLLKADAEKIRSFLLNEKNRINKQMMVGQLYKELNVKNLLSAIRYDVGVTAGMPKIGKDTAPITIQVFCDFGNPSCSRSRLAMVQLKNELGENLRWIYRHFPVASSAVGMKASLVALCSHKQGKFWEIHDAFYDQQASLSNETLEKIAVSKGLSESELSSCLQSQGTQSELDAEIRAGQMLGINSTPVYFVNGVRVTNVDLLFEEARKISIKPIVESK